jgi:hypothetical protein
MEGEPESFNARERSKRLVDSARQLRQLAEQSRQTSRQRLDQARNTLQVSWLVRTRESGCGGATRDRHRARRWPGDKFIDQGGCRLTSASARAQRVVATHGHMVQARLACRSQHWRHAMRHAMDPRLSALPYSAQVAVANAKKILDRARIVLATKQEIADRADRRSRAAGVVAGRLQRNMANVEVRGAAVARRFHSSLTLQVALFRRSSSGRKTDERDCSLDTR